MNIFLWVLAGVLAAVFLLAGARKATQPMAKLAEDMSFVNDASEAQVRAIGVVEILGALGLILPAASPWSSPRSPRPAWRSPWWVPRSCTPDARSSLTSPSTWCWAGSPCWSRSCVSAPTPSDPPTGPALVQH